MKPGACQALCSAAMILCATLRAAPLSTVQNSTLSVPAADIAASGVPGSTNLVGSNFLMSALSPSTPHGGRARLVNSQRWVQRYPVGLQSQQSSATGIVIRRDGSIVATGYSHRSATADDFLTICYAADGKPLWTNLYDGPVHGIDEASYVAASAVGDVWVVGASARSATNWRLDDVALIKYASNGVPLWTNRYTTVATNDDYPTALVVDSSGNAYVTLGSTYWPPGEYGGFPRGNTIIKYDSLGGPALDECVFR